MTAEQAKKRSQGATAADLEFEYSDVMRLVSGATRLKRYSVLAPITPNAYDQLVKRLRDEGYTVTYSWFDNLLTGQSKWCRIRWE